MDFSRIIISQYQAALEMLKQTIIRCPNPIWDSPEDKTRFWPIANYALFYSHFYLQDSEQSFRPWNRHRKAYQFLGPIPGSAQSSLRIGNPYDNNELLEYLNFCRQQVAELVPQLKPEAPSGFDRLPFDKLELQLYNLQHHTGELMERLGERAEIEIDWVIEHSN